MRAPSCWRPPTTQLLLLSGSVENPQEVAEWMRRIGRKVEVVATHERPVPLDEMPVETCLPQRSREHRRLVAAHGRRGAAGGSRAAADIRAAAAGRGKHRATSSPRICRRASRCPSRRSSARSPGKEFAALLEKRVAYHHSGLGYAVRAGLVEPLAKAGQLRVIVSTMGLAAGINFSVRSVHVASTTFHDGLAEQPLTPDELLQMFGRAGRRGLDERGYVITSRDSPTLADARAARLRRASRLSWPLFLRIMRRAALDGRAPFDAAREFAQKLFSKTPPELGLEETGGFPLSGAAGACAVRVEGQRAANCSTAPAPGRKCMRAARDQMPLGEAWLAPEDYRGPALASTRFVQTLAARHRAACSSWRPRGDTPATARKSRLEHKERGAIAPAESTGTRRPLSMADLRTDAPQTPAHSKEHPALSPEKIEKVALPKLVKFFPGAGLPRLCDKEGLRWAQFDFSAMPVEAVRDSHGRWLTQPRIRTVELGQRKRRFVINGASAFPHAARPGTPVHAWRALGLIEADGTPTRRGIIFSFFQHGEGLAIAAALEDETYPDR